METPNSIIVLSGPVGAGKTTVAHQLVPLLPGPVAYIEGNKFWHFIAKGIDSLSEFENFKMVMRSMTLASMSYARAGYMVVLDFSMPPWYVQPILKILEARKIPVEYVVIRPALEICAERAANRTERIINDYADYEELYNFFDEAPKNIICDNKGDALTIANHIIEGLNEGIFRITDY